MLRTFQRAVALLIVVLAAPAAAQDEDALRSYFQGRRVTVRIDMPGTQEGVDVWVDGRRPIDYARYRSRLRSYGTAIHAGESVPVTLVKMKKDLIEFQLGGGGFGTFGDDTSTSVYLPLLAKSDRETELERLVRNADSRDDERRLRRELDELRRERDRTNERLEQVRVLAEERKQELVAERRIAGGSRFNLRYDGAVPRGIRPEEVMAALAEYVDFSPAGRPRAEDSWLRKGMTRADAERELGSPIEYRERREGTLTVTTLHFVRANRRIAAEFVEDVLVRYAVTSW
jgi:hypothetical protein